jgi:hypothetical protein
MPRRKPEKDAKTSTPAQSGGREDDTEEVEAEATDTEESVPEPEEAEPDLESLAGGDEEEEDEEDEEEEPILADDLEETEVVAEVRAPVVPRPPLRPTPGRPPSAKEEPEPPFAVGERIVLISNTRPRTGAPISDHPVGALGRVETVLSQTAIVRFDRAPDTKEVVAFTCLESVDEEAKAAKAAREKEREREARERAREAER